MKRRFGFVSNSSSSSFIINLRDISAEQLVKIQNHVEFGKENDILYCDPSDAWTIEVTGIDVRGQTNMDNFSMEDFLRRIGVPADKITWGEGYDW